MPATQLLGDKDLGLLGDTTYDVLTMKTVKGSWVEKERQHSPSNSYLSTPLGQRVSRMLFVQVADPSVSFTWIPQILN